MGGAETHIGNSAAGPKRAHLGPEGARWTPVIALALLLFGFIWLHLYVSHPASPVEGAGQSWYGWWDQGNYIRSARALAVGNLAASEHWYPVGYAMLGAPFAFLGFSDPFAIVNFILFLWFVWLFWRTFSPFVGELGAVGAFAVAVFLPLRTEIPYTTELPFLVQFVIPWNTIPIAPLYLALFLTIRKLDTSPGLTRDILIGAIAAWIICLRITDAFPLVFAAAAYLVIRFRSARFWKHIVSACIGGLGVLMPFVWLMLAIHGGIQPGYLQVSADIGLSASDLHERATQILFDASATHGEPESALFDLNPILALALPFALLWGVRGGINGALLVLTAIASIALYLAYNDFWPYNVIRFYLVHYIVWTFPVLIAAGLAGIMALARDGAWRAALGAAAASIALLNLDLGLHPIEGTRTTTEVLAEGGIGYTIALPARSEIDAIDFLSASAPEGRDPTLLPIKVFTDGGRELKVFSGYRTIQLSDRLRVLFNTHIVADEVTIRFDQPLRVASPDGPIISAMVFTPRFGKASGDKSEAD